MSFRRRLKHKRPPAGWDKIEETIEDFEAQMRDVVAEGHEGERRAALSWKVHRVHWEKNRFIFDLVYVRKVMSRELYDWLVREKVADGALIAKWRKPGYEFLCSLLAIQRAGTTFGTTALCRVPLKQRTEQQKVNPSVQTGCVSCASCDAGKHDGPIWWDQLDDSEDEEEGEREGARVEESAAAAAARPPPPEEREGEPAAKRAKPSDVAAAAAAASRDEEKEEAEEDEEELDEEVQKRLEALKDGGGG